MSLIWSCSDYMKWWHYDDLVFQVLVLLIQAIYRCQFLDSFCCFSGYRLSVDLTLSRAPSFWKFGAGLIIKKKFEAS